MRCQMPVNNLKIQYVRSVEKRIKFTSLRFEPLRLATKASFSALEAIFYKEKLLAGVDDELWLGAKEEE